MLLESLNDRHFHRLSETRQPKNSEFCFSFRLQSAVLTFWVDAQI